MKSLILAFALFGADDVQTIQLPEAHVRVTEKRVELSALFRAGKTDEALALVEKVTEEEPWHSTLRMTAYGLARYLNRQDLADKWSDSLEAIGISASGLEELMDPAGKADLVAELPDTRLCESVQQTADGSLLVGCVVDRTIYKTSPDGKISTLVDAVGTNGLSVLGIALAPDGTSVWAALGKVDPTPTREGESAGEPGWASFDIDSGDRQRSLIAPEGVSPGDIFVTKDGTVLASNSQAGELYDLSADEPALLFRIDGRASFQGIAESSDGKIYVADYSNGLWEWDRQGDGTFRLLRSKYLLSGYDGLGWVNGGLVAVRNGFQPHRVVWFPVADGEIGEGRVLASALEEFIEPTTGHVAAGSFLFVANSQWPVFDKGGKVKEGNDLAPTRIMKIRLDHIGGARGKEDDQP